MAAQTFITLVAGVFKQITATLVGGSSSYANQIPALGASGQLDITMMPTGIGPDTASIVASEALAAGAIVNVWSNSGTANVRNADTSGASAGKMAHGFVLAAVSSGATATVYYSGENTALTGLTPGPLYLGTAGAVTATAPSTSGYTVQRVGFAYSATAAQMNLGEPVVLA